jgi:hypothetical protein
MGKVYPEELKKKAVELYRAVPARRADDLRRGRPRSGCFGRDGPQLGPAGQP